MLAGSHLEGPFMSSTRCGAHAPRRHLREPQADDVKSLLDAGRGAIRMVTLAPELPGGLDAVRAITDAGAIAAAGHTEASYETTRNAVEAGVRVATHLLNAMPPLHHRDPGAALALLEDERVTNEAIADGVQAGVFA